MIVLGLTGSIAMGKSTTAAMLEQCGVAVHDSDEAVHEMFLPGGRAVPAIADAFPYAVYPKLYGKKIDGVKPIVRAELGKIVFNDEDLLSTLEAITHPLVRDSQTAFIRKHTSMGADIVALDIPLLFETGGEDFVDYTLVVSAPYEVQRQRALERPGMDEARF